VWYVFKFKCALAIQLHLEEPLLRPETNDTTFLILVNSLFLLIENFDYFIGK